LLTGLQVVEWFLDLVEAQTAIGQLSAAAFAGIFLVAVLWDVLTSGEEITNGNSPAFPREGRVMLYLGYTLVASSVLLYTASVQVPVTGALSTDALNTSDDAALGLLILAPPLIGLSLVLRFTGWLALQRPMTYAPDSRTTTSQTLLVRGIQATIIGAGGVALVAVLALTAFWIVPRAEQSARLAPLLITPSPGTQIVGTPSNRPPLAPYQAQVPGPGCDSAGANWAIAPAGTQAVCRLAGLQVSLEPNASVVLQFIPPEQSITANYQVSAQVDMSGMVSGCLGIINEVSSQGIY
jgi:hypothetical protein